MASDYLRCTGTARQPRRIQGTNATGREYDFVVVPVAQDEIAATVDLTLGDGMTPPAADSPVDYVVEVRNGKFTAVQTWPSSKPALRSAAS